MAPTTEYVRLSRERGKRAGILTILLCVLLHIYDQSIYTQSHYMYQIRYFNIHNHGNTLLLQNYVYYYMSLSVYVSRGAAYLARMKVVSLGSTARSSAGSRRGTLLQPRTSRARSVGAQCATSASSARGPALSRPCMESSSSLQPCATATTPSSPTRTAQLSQRDVSAGHSRPTTTSAASVRSACLVGG